MIGWSLVVRRQGISLCCPKIIQRQYRGLAQVRTSKDDQLIQYNKRFKNTTSIPEFLANNQLGKAEEMIVEKKQNNVERKDSYNDLFAAYVKKGMSRKDIDMIREMKEKGVTGIYNLLRSIGTYLKVISYGGCGSSSEDQGSWDSNESKHLPLPHHILS